jgi:hypothetical protein
MRDETLYFLGRIGFRKAGAYSRIDPARLPDDLRRLLEAYRYVLLGIVAFIGLPLMSLRLLTVACSLPLVVGLFFLKAKMERQLDPALAPYAPRSPQS